MGMLMLLLVQASMLALATVLHKASLPAVNENRAVTNIYTEYRNNSATADNLNTQQKVGGVLHVKRRHAAWRHKRQVTCPKSWSVNKGHCYRFFSQPATWEDAKRQCHNHSACLAEVRNVDENNFLGNLAINDSGNVIINPVPEECWSRYCKNSSDCIWIGLTDRQQQGNFRWEGCESSPLQWSKWNAGEPNNDRDYFEDCVEMIIKQTDVPKYSWNDMQCHCFRGFFCKKDALAQPPSEMSTTIRVTPATASTTLENITTTSTMTTTYTEDTVVIQSSSSFWNWQLNIAGVVTLVALLIIVAAFVLVTACVLCQKAAVQRAIEEKNRPTKSSDRNSEHDYSTLNKNAMHLYSSAK